MSTSGKLNTVDNYDVVVKDANAINQLFIAETQKGTDFVSIGAIIRRNYPEFYESYSVIIKYIYAGMYVESAFVKFLKWLNSTIKKVGIHDHDHYMFLQCRYIVYYKWLTKKFGPKIANKIHDTEYERQKAEYEEYKKQALEIYEQVEQQKNEASRNQLKQLLDEYSLVKSNNGSE